MDVPLSGVGRLEVHLVMIADAELWRADVLYELPLIVVCVINRCRDISSFVSSSESLFNGVHRDHRVSVRVTLECR